MVPRTPRRSEHGFSLVELMVTVAVLSLLMTLAVPSFAEWIQNSRIRTAAESIQNGLQVARAEAVRRNARVEFALVGQRLGIDAAALGPLAPAFAAGRGAARSAG